jgi:hypothetical protein
MTQEDFKTRTKQFGLRVIRLVDALPLRRASVRKIADQLLRAGTSVGANYRAACRGRSRAEFCAKLVRPALLAPLIKEGAEILAIVVASITTARGRRVSGRS